MKKEDKIIIFAFWFMIIFALIISLFSLIKYNYKLKFGGLSHTLEPIAVNVTTNKPLKDLKICFDENCENADADIYSQYYFVKYQAPNQMFFKKPVKNIYIALPLERKDYIKYINDVFFCIGNIPYYLDLEQIEGLQKEKEQIKKIENVDYALFQISSKSNYKGIYNNICNSFLSLFYCWNFAPEAFILPYIWLFCAFLLWVYNKEKFNFKINSKFMLILITLIGALLRLNIINYNPLWTDEVYTLDFAIKSLASCFQDPGNPPLFNILELMFTKIWGVSNVGLRLLPYLISVGVILLFYLFFKKIGKPIALFASFFASINADLVFHSVDARSYSLCIFLGILTMYTLFNYLKNPTNKNLIFYALSSICAVNTHYYLVIYVLSNFIWGICDLIRKKNGIFKFVCSNIAVFLTFLPYYLMTYKISIYSNFNSWIKEFGILPVKYTVEHYFYNKYIFCFLVLAAFVNLIIIFMPKNLKDKINLEVNKKKAYIFVYLIYSITFTIFIICMISIFIKPIFQVRLFMSISFLLLFAQILLICGVYQVKNEKSKLKIFLYLKSFLFLLLIFLTTKSVPFENLFRYDEFIYFVKQDAKRYQKDYDISIIMVSIMKNSSFLSELQKEKYINWHFVNTNLGVIDEIANLKKSDYSNKKKTVIYTPATAMAVSKIGVCDKRVIGFWTNYLLIYRIKFEDDNQKDEINTCL